MMYTACKISRGFAEVLLEQGELEVVSIFRDALNLQSKSGVYTLQSARVEFSPLSMVLEGFVDFTRLLLTPGERLQVLKGRIVSPYCIFDYSAATSQGSVLKPTKDFQYLRNSMKRSIHVLVEEMESLLQKSPGDSGFGDTVLRYQDFEALPQETKNPERSFLGRYLFQLLNEYIEAFLKNRDSAPEALVKFVGLGHGLTPSGDDFLLGMLSMLHFVGGRSLEWKAFQGHLEKVIETHHPSTTQVSSAYLREALRKNYSAPVLAFYEAMESHKEDALRGAIHRMAHLGHSSGLDTLSGILMMMKTLGFAQRYGDEDSSGS